MGRKGGWGNGLVQPRYPCVLFGTVRPRTECHSFIEADLHEERDCETKGSLENHRCTPRVRLTLIPHISRRQVIEFVA